ncbi:beta-galactosidase [Myceligenerans pegani]|uniref:beta-galactosidase n=1 Tax=Myceligenerans pegani TaxID=2776917 RepID=A0ABR9N520_9MICO|nr:beta-galactosidase [Myceligenerans sp. TRM 65318]MBE1878743.1 beta-galactosidase [Myceligenerans sp. TRM 65318]MBE3021014.1 beta-galactosidase [Myceligenerans sp. TRM 65318]
MRRRTSPSGFDTAGIRPWNAGIDGLAFGGDYNPEQWPDDVRLEDIELMREAGVNIVSLAIFAWATVEPREGEFDWAWLDTTMDRLHAAGIRVALATATAAAPPWLTRKHPEILPQRSDGTVLHQGSRQTYSIHHPVFRDYAVGMAERVARRYADHPALALWHVDNEIGCHNPRDWSPAAADAFRDWLRERYGDLDDLNEAWGTAFWSQRYGSFDDVLPPRDTTAFGNPTQLLDFDRFNSDALLDYYRDLRDTLREITPHVPTTTNLMAGSHKEMDYFSWADDLDVVANDNYTLAADPDRHLLLSLSADLSRGIAGGDPWILMEHSTSAVNWQSRNRAKQPGEMLRNSLAHVARGSDAVMFFQWRASKAGAEKYHSALVPHAGTDSDLWRDVVALGGAVKALGEVRGSRVVARTALVLDWPAWWACEQDVHPTQVQYPDQVLAWYKALWRLGVTVDVVPPSRDLDGYDLVVVPTLYLVSDADAARVRAAAERGATVLITYFSGIVDENDHIRLGGYPGAYRDLLGVRTEEFFPLQEGESVRVSGASLPGGGLTADLWTEKSTVTDGVEVIAAYDDGPLPGGPAITRRTVPAGGDPGTVSAAAAPVSTAGTAAAAGPGGSAGPGVPAGSAGSAAARSSTGSAWYVATRLSDEGVAHIARRVADEAGVLPSAAVPEGVEVVRRVADGVEFVFAINHTDAEVTVDAGRPAPLSDTDAALAAVVGTDLLTGEDVTSPLTIPAGGVRVVRVPV